MYNSCNILPMLRFSKHKPGVNEFHFSISTKSESLYQPVSSWIMWSSPEALVVDIEKFERIVEASR